MQGKLGAIIHLIKQSASEWADDKAPRLGAALSYYTIFSISPLLVIVIAIAGLWFGEEAAHNQIFHQISGLVGEEGGKAIQSLLVSANKPEEGILAAIMALMVLLLGATGVFVQLQDALNTIWNVPPKSGGGIWSFVRGRLLSFAMVIGIGFLLLVSLIVSAALSAFGSHFAGSVPGFAILGQMINFLVSFAVVTLLFAMIFKYMPDVKIAWHDVWIGAAFTAFLFNIGKYLLGVYLARSTVASAYGAAGSVVIVLIWVYYSAQIVFFGAELTQVYANVYGSHLAPKAKREPATSALPSEESSRRPASASMVIPERRRPIPEFHPTRKDIGMAALFVTACAMTAKWLKRRGRA
jgi:membrane protein